MPFQCLIPSEKKTESERDRRSKWDGHIRPETYSMQVRKHKMQVLSYILCICCSITVVVTNLHYWRGQKIDIDYKLNFKANTIFFIYISQFNMQKQLYYAIHMILWMKNVCHIFRTALFATGPKLQFESGFLFIYLFVAWPMADRGVFVIIKRVSENLLHSFVYVFLHYWGGNKPPILRKRDRVSK